MKKMSERKRHILFTSCSDKKCLKQVLRVSEKRVERIYKDKKYSNI